LAGDDGQAYHVILWTLRPGWRLRRVWKLKEGLAKLDDAELT
jgi:hypothetical protein